MVQDVAPDRGSQRLSLRASQSQQLKRSSLFEGFTYEPSQSSMAGGARALGVGSEDLMDALDRSDGESESD